YRFTDHITVVGSPVSPDDPASEPASDLDDPASGHIDDPANRRRAWVIMELKRGHELRRSDLMTRFEVSESTAKRDLRALIEGGQVAFVGPTKTGHYELKAGRS
ncbi:MAG: DeoR family transcriptional regulator, partial [Phycisphaerales bacterium]|nr:DeoR family transcriptional regulator [Phycisphaerales bacterium]